MSKMSSAERQRAYKERQRIRMAEDPEYAVSVKTKKASQDKAHYEKTGPKKQPQDNCKCGNEKDRRANNCRSCSGNLKRTNFNCSVEGCEKDAWSKSLCPMYLRRQRIHEDVGKVIKGPESDYWNHRTPMTVDSYDLCWEWTGHVTNKFRSRGGKYGFVMIDGKRSVVSRLSWEAANNEIIPQGMEVCHRCDNPTCWRPDHLFLGTHRDNMDDMVSKGRSRSKHSDYNIAINKKKVWENSHGICGLCKTVADPTNWHIDHIIPLSKGGSDTYDNVQVSHPLCNWKKNNQNL